MLGPICEITASGFTRRYVFYLKGGDQDILIDTGLEQFMVPEGAQREYGFQILEFEEAPATLNLKPADIDTIEPKTGYVE